MKFDKRDIKKNEHLVSYLLGCDEGCDVGWRDGCTDGRLSDIFWVRDKCNVI